MVTGSASTLPFVGIAPPRPRAVKAWPTPAATAGLTIGIVCNPKARLNRGAEYEAGVPGADRVIVAAPRTRTALPAILADFAARHIDLLVIDGGDGTVRDVLTAAEEVWGARWPRIVVIPSGKTNALAIDLGLPVGWTLAQGLDAARGGRVAVRHPVEIRRAGGGRALRGFLFGAGAFVDATKLAQRTHHAGAFNGIAVGLALGWAILQTLWGPKTHGWRAGTPMRLQLDGGRVETHARYILLASTLERLPVGLKPFGTPRPGLKLLSVDAPPRHLWRAAPAIVAGSRAPWLARAGYRHHDPAALDVTLTRGFILDGEQFPGGALHVGSGPKLSFVVP